MAFSQATRACNAAGYNPLLPLIFPPEEPSQTSQPCRVEISHNPTARPHHPPAHLRAEHPGRQCAHQRLLVGLGGAVRGLLGQEGEGGGGGGVLTGDEGWMGHGGWGRRRSQMSGRVLQRS